MEVNMMSPYSVLFGFISVIQHSPVLETPIQTYFLSSGFPSRKPKGEFGSVLVDFLIVLLLVQACFSSVVVIS